MSIAAITVIALIAVIGTMAKIAGIVFATSIILLIMSAYTEEVFKTGASRIARPFTVLSDQLLAAICVAL